MRLNVTASIFNNFQQPFFVGKHRFWRISTMTWSKAILLLFQIINRRGSCRVDFGLDITSKKINAPDKVRRTRGPRNVTVIRLTLYRAIIFSEVI